MQYGVDFCVLAVLTRLSLAVQRADACSISSLQLTDVGLMIP